MDSTELGHFSLLEKDRRRGHGPGLQGQGHAPGTPDRHQLLAEARLEDSGRRARFVQEAKAPSALNHPNIITIHELASRTGNLHRH
jgi:hypothetical protein